MLRDELMQMACGKKRYCIMNTSSKSSCSGCSPACQLRRSSGGHRMPAAFPFFFFFLHCHCHTFSSANHPISILPTHEGGWSDASGVSFLRSWGLAGIQTHGCFALEERPPSCLTGRHHELWKEQTKKNTILLAVFHDSKWRRLPKPF